MKATIQALVASLALVGCGNAKDEPPKHILEEKPAPPPSPPVDAKPEAKVSALTGIAVTVAEGPMMSDSVQITVAAVDKDGKPVAGDHQYHVEFVQGDVDLCDLWIESDSQNPFTTSPSLPKDKKNCVRPQGGAPVKARLTESASNLSASVDVGAGVADRLAKIAAFDTPPEGGRMNPKPWAPMDPDAMAKALDADLADMAKVVALIDATPLAKTPMKLCEPNQIVGHDPPTADYETLRMLAGKPPTLPDDKGAFAPLNSSATKVWIEHHAGRAPPSGGYGEATERQLVTGRKLLVVYHASTRRLPVVTTDANRQLHTNGVFHGGAFVGSIDLVDRSQNKLLCRHTLSVGNTDDVKLTSADETAVLQDLQMNVQLAAFDAVNQMSGREVMAKDWKIEAWRENHPTLPKAPR